MVYLAISRPVGLAKSSQTYRCAELARKPLVRAHFRYIIQDSKLIRIVASIAIMA